MLSLPDDWDYSLNGLVAVSKEGVKSIRNALKELQQWGYLVINKIKNKLGKFEYKYLIREIPYIRKGDMEKDIQIIINNKDDKIDKNILSSFLVSNEHHLLTLKLIKEKYIEEDDYHIFSYDELFNSLINVTCYIVKKVKNRNFVDENGNVINNKFGYFKSAIENNLVMLNKDYSGMWFSGE